MHTTSSSGSPGLRSAVFGPSRAFRNTLAIICVLLFAQVGLAQPSIPDPGTTVYPDQFVVKVLSQTADVFEPQVQGGHGTGFVYQIDREMDEVTIFTNHHVVATSKYDVQRVFVEVNAEKGLPESVAAEVLYRSNLHDFAVLKIRFSDLKRTGQRIMEAPIPPQGHPFLNPDPERRLLQGRPVIAFGNPLGSDNIATRGDVTGLWNMPSRSRFSDLGTPFLQTSAAINPGNSGGPLIDEETGLVIGINSAGILDANLVGFAMPIGQAIMDYLSFLENPSIQYEKISSVIFGMLPVSHLRSLPEGKVLFKTWPGITDEHERLLRVQDSLNPALNTGDLIVEVNGVVIGASFYKLKLIAAQSDRLSLRIVRNSQVLTVEIPTPSEGIRRLRESMDFVYISGLMLGEYNDRDLFTSAGRETSRVKVEDMNPSDPDMAHHSSRYPNEGSLVVGLNIEGKDYRIRNLYDVKMALRSHPNAKLVRMEVREAIQLMTEHGPLPISTQYATPALHPTIHYYYIPTTTIVTPRNFSLQRFKEGFSFAPEEGATRDWRRHVKSRTSPFASSGCGELMEAASRL